MSLGTKFGRPRYVISLLGQNKQCNIVKNRKEKVQRLHYRLRLPTFNFRYAYLLISLYILIKKLNMS